MSAVTKDIVLKVKSYLSNDKYAGLTNDELALLCGTSPASVSRISKGQYDHLLEVVQPVVTGEEGVVVPIDYKTLKHLLSCEYAVETIPKMAMPSTVADGTLFISAKAVYGALSAYVPEDVEARLKEIREEEYNE